MRYLPARLWGLAVASGLLQVLPFPIAGPLPQWRTAFAWIALLPLLYALLSRDSRGRSLSVRQSAALGYLCGVVWYAGNCYWIFQTMNLYGGLPKPVALGILLLFALYLGLYHAVFAGLVAAFRRLRGRNGALALAPFAWVAVELARARITGFPWDLLGMAQIDNPVLARLAPFTGAYGLSFAVAAVNSMWLMRITIRDRRYTRPALTVAAMVLFVGNLAALHAWSRPRVNPATATATLVQENLSVGAARVGLPESKQQLLDSFTQLSAHPSPIFFSGIPEMPGTPEVVMLHKGGSDAQQVPEGKDETRSWTPRTDVIVWPEAPAGFFTTDPEFTGQMHRLADSSGALVIAGSLGVEAKTWPALDRSYSLFDSATFFEPGEHAMARYDKIHLVPWGEYIPFKRFFFFAKKLTAGVGDMEPGTERLVQAYGGHRYGAFICYESIFGDEIRQFVKHGAEALVMISDDGWYGDTGAPWQHLNMVRMRAIENHRWILRSTNTGVTAAIDPDGRVTVAAPRHIRTSLYAPFGYESDTTFYTSHGDVFAYCCTLIALGTLSANLLMRRGRRDE